MNANADWMNELIPPEVRITNSFLRDSELYTFPTILGSTTHMRVRCPLSHTMIWYCTSMRVCICICIYACSRRAMERIHPAHLLRHECVKPIRPDVYLSICRFISRKYTHMLHIQILAGRTDGRYQTFNYIGTSDKHHKDIYTIGK